MTIAVAYKWAADPQEAQVGEDGTVDWSRAKPGVAEYDAVAVEAARLLAEPAAEECVAVSVGPAATGSSLARKGIMSRGADRGLAVADDAVRSWPTTQQAEALAALVGRSGADVVITGDTSVDENARMMSGLVAGFLGWPCLQMVSRITRTDDALELVQAVAGGTRTLHVTGPVVVAVTSDCVPTRVPGMKEILAAGRKPFDVVAVEDLTTTPVSLPVTGARRPDGPRRARRTLTGPDAVADLVAALHADQVL